MNKPTWHYVLAVILYLSLVMTLQAQTRELIALCDSIGTEIDATERERYRLFPDITGFQSAQIFRTADDKYQLVYTTKEETGIRPKTRSLSANAIAMTRHHLQLFDAYHLMAQNQQIDRTIEALVLHKLILRYAAEARYAESRQLFDTLVQEFPDVKTDGQMMQLQTQIAQLAVSKNGLFLKGSLMDRSGRTELLIFSGYYGLWAGIAIPAALQADSPQAHALGLILGGPLSVALTHSITKEASISSGRATMIALGGHLGTWQGLGWAGVADKPAHAIITSGLLAGLTGIGAATAMTNHYDFSTGHAAVTNSSAHWGAWFGLIFAMLSDQEDKKLLRSMLISTDMAVLSTGFLAKNIKMSKARMRLIDLSGVIGTMIGFGTDMLFEVNNEHTAFAIAGLGSIGGLWAGTAMTKTYDQSKEISLLNGNIRYALKNKNQIWELSPRMALQPHPFKPYRFIPTLGVQFAKR
jgi:hypothetical protein